MAEQATKGPRICPRCGETYEGYPALSRADNKTLICDSCGTAEAIEEYLSYESEE